VNEMNSVHLSFDAIVDSLASDQRTLSATERALLTRLLYHGQAGGSREENEFFARRLRRALGQVIAERVLGLLAGGVADRILGIQSAAEMSMSLRQSDSGATISPLFDPDPFFPMGPGLTPLFESDPLVAELNATEARSEAETAISPSFDPDPFYGPDPFFPMGPGLTPIF
jgi:hypothetical protein